MKLLKIKVANIKSIENSKDKLNPKSKNTYVGNNGKDKHTRIKCTKYKSPIPLEECSKVKLSYSSTFLDLDYILFWAIPSLSRIDERSLTSLQLSLCPPQACPFPTIDFFSYYPFVSVTRA